MEDRRLSEEVLSLSKNEDGPAYYYVYLIRSIDLPDIVYVGYTTNLKQRLKTHNSGGSVHTKKDRPWKLIVCLSFSEMLKAKNFEKYLKSQSGRAFAKKRFW